MKNTNKILRHGEKKIILKQYLYIIYISLMMKSTGQKLKHFFVYQISKYLNLKVHQIKTYISFYQYV